MVVDASVWVSALVGRDTHHGVSRRWLQQRLEATEPLIAPTLLLPEVAGAVARRTGAAEDGLEAAAEIQTMSAVRLVSLDAAICGEAARLAATLKLRGADAVYVAVARALNLAVVTWDQEIILRAGGIIEVIQPV